MKKALNSARNQGSSKKVLITGVAGFAGSHLAEFLTGQKFRVFGFYHSGHSHQNTAHLKSRITLIPCDLLRRQEVERNITRIEPDYVFHLAAFSAPAVSFINPREVLANNIFGQLNLLLSLVKINSPAKILIVGSADEYGKVDEKLLPANEKTPLAPISPYAVSKVAQDLLGFQFYLHYKLNIVRVRPFNHIGPRQSNDFVVPAFASQIVQLEEKGRGTVRVGNLDVWRDFTDVRDIVRGYLLALEKGISGEVYNIGSGKLYKIADVLKILISLSRAKIRVRQDSSRTRPDEIQKVSCDFSKFRKQTGWQPKIPILKTLSDTMDYERWKLSQSEESKSKV